jgi:ubiquinone/menaquinone biosynthesis C-methylase UbiE
MSAPSHSVFDAWSSFWAAGHIGSCVRGREEDETLARDWLAYFSTAPDGVRVLDLATGNGAVPRWAVQAARARGVRFEVTGVDAATVGVAKDPTAAALLREVTLISAVAIEALPFPNACFDRLTSQFGFEYADEQRATLEAVRVLTTGGRGRFVMHAREGGVEFDVRDRVARLAFALSEGEILDLLGRALTSATATPRPAEIAAAMERASFLWRAPPPDDAALFYAQGFHDLWRQRARYEPTELSRAAADGLRRAEGVLLRQQALLNAARSRKEADALAGRFRDAGVDVESPTPVLNDQGVQIGWRLDFSKPA